MWAESSAENTPNMYSKIYSADLSNWLKSLEYFLEKALLGVHGFIH